MLTSGSFEGCLELWKEHFPEKLFVFNSCSKKRLKGHLWFFFFETSESTCHSFLGRKAMTNVDSVLKNRDITLPTKIHVVKAMVVRAGKEGGVLKNWCLTVYRRRLLRVPWTARGSNKSILREIHLECSLERLMLKLKLQYFGYPIRTTDSLEKSLMLGKIEGRRRGH